MAEDNTTSGTEFEECREMERRITQFVEGMARQWLQGCAALKDPEETLRQEEEQIRLEIQKELQNANSYLQGINNSGTTSNYHACLTFALERLTFAVERATNLNAQLGIFNRDYDSRKNKLQTKYSRQVKKLIERLFSALDNPPLQEAFRQIFRVYVSTPGFPAQTSSLSSAISVGGSSRAPSREPEPSAGPSAGHPEQEARNTHLPNEENSINAAGASTVTSGTASSSATEQLTRKRSQPDSLIHTFQLPPDKLMRLDKTAKPPLQTIEFADVYCNGKAPVKRFIVNYGEDYYILRCDKHNMNFDEGNALQAAAKHLVSKKHGGILSRTYWVAVRHLGIRVLNCCTEKQKMNNEAFMRPGNSNNNLILQPEETTDHRDAQTQRQNPPFRNTRSKRHCVSETIIDPKVGGIYLVYWGAALTWRISIVLPRDCFDDPSFADIGLWGCLADTSLWGDMPECYCTCEVSRRIVGWADGFEDGGDNFGGRRYPVMRFEDDVEHLHESLLKWVSTTDLEAFDGQSLASNRKLIPNYAALHNFLSGRDQDTVAAGSWEEEDMIEVSSSEAMDLDESESDTSQPPEQHWGFQEIRQERTSPLTSPPGSPNYTEPGPSSTWPNHQSLHGAPMGSELWDQLIARPPDAWEQRVRHGVFIPSGGPSKDSTPIPEPLPIPFPNLENR